MGTSYYNHYFDIPGLEQGFQDILGAINQAPIKEGKWGRQIMHDPMNSSLAAGWRSSLGAGIRGLRENFTADPELMQVAPQLAADKLNKAEQDMTVNSQAAFQQALAGLQSQLYQAKMARKMAKWGSAVGAYQDRFGKMGDLAEVRKGFNWLSLLPTVAGIAAAPFTGGLSAIPGLAATAGGGLASSMMNGALSGAGAAAPKIPGSSSGG